MCAHPAAARAQHPPVTCCRQPLHPAVHQMATIESINNETGTILRVPLTLSYGTCGYLSSFASREAQARVLRAFAAKLPGGKLRVAFPGDSGSGYTLVSSRPYPEGAINAGQL